MWQRFSEGARKVIFYAQEEAQAFGCHYVGPEHMLLGLLREEDSTAIKVLQSLGVDVARLKDRVRSGMTSFSDELPKDMTLTPRAKRTIDLAYEFARNLNNNYIGTEHFLLALLGDPYSEAGKALAEYNVEVEQAKSALIVLWKQEGRAHETNSPTPTTGEKVNEQQRFATALLQMRQARYSLELLFLLLVGFEDGPVSKAFHQICNGPRACITALEATMLNTASERTADPSGQVLERVILRASKIAMESGKESGTAELFLSMLQESDSILVKILSEYGVTFENCKTYFDNRQ